MRIPNALSSATVILASRPKCTLPRSARAGRADVRSCTGCGRGQWVGRPTQGARVVDDRLRGPTDAQSERRAAKLCGLPEAGVCVATFGELGSARKANA